MILLCYACVCDRRDRCTQREAKRLPCEQQHIPCVGDGSPVPMQVDSEQFTVDSCGVFLRKIIKIVGKADTINVNYQLSIVNYLSIDRRAADSRPYAHKRTPPA